MSATHPAVTAAAEALSIIGGVPDIWDLRAAGIAVAAARPIIEAERDEKWRNFDLICVMLEQQEAEVRERIAADIEAEARQVLTDDGAGQVERAALLDAARIARGQS